MIHPFKSALSKLTKISYYKAQLSINKARIYLAATDGHSENCAFLYLLLLRLPNPKRVWWRAGVATSTKKIPFFCVVWLWPIPRIERWRDLGSDIKIHGDWLWYPWDTYSFRAPYSLAAMRYLFFLCSFPFPCSSSNRVLRESRSCGHHSLGAQLQLLSLWLPHRPGLCALLRGPRPWEAQRGGAAAAGSQEIPKVHGVYAGIRKPLRRRLAGGVQGAGKAQRGMFAYQIYFSILD